jgi:hypothetical protein
MADLIEAPAPAAPGSPAPRTPFWDLAPAGVYLQFDERLVTPWERVKLAGVDLPGVCSVASPGRIRKVQTMSGPGDEGEIVLDVGAMAADVSITVRMWTPAHLAQWEAFTDEYERLLLGLRVGDDVWTPPIFPAAVPAAPIPAQPTPQDATVPALDVIHPGLALANITRIYVYQVGIPAPSSVKGLYEATILGSEYRHVKKAKKQSVSPVSNSLDGLDKKTLSGDLRKGVTEKPSVTEAKP